MFTSCHGKQRYSLARWANKQEKFIVYNGMVWREEASVAGWLTSLGLSHLAFSFVEKGLNADIP